MIGNQKEFICIECDYSGPTLEDVSAHFKNVHKSELRNLLADHERRERKKQDRIKEYYESNPPTPTTGICSPLL